jgi:hypothetical protein
MCYNSTPLTNQSTVTSNMIASLLVDDTLIDRIIDNVSNYLPVNGRPRETDPDRSCRYACDPNATRMRPEGDPKVIQMQTRPNDSADMPAITTYRWHRTATEQTRARADTHASYISFFYGPGRAILKGGVVDNCLPYANLTTTVLLRL